MKKVGFAVVGIGNIGKRHLAVLEKEKHAEIVALCDKDKHIAEEYGRKYNVPYFFSYQKMLKKIDCDIVNICTPHYFHAPMTIAASNAKKHILVEKPMALTSRDCQRMIAAANKNNVKLMVVKQNRYNVPIALAKKVLEQGKLGKIFMVEVNVFWNRNDAYYSSSPWRGRKHMEGGSLYTQVSHFIDLLIWFFGDIKKAKTVIDTKNHDITIEDCGSSIVTFTRGVLGVINWTTCVYRTNYEGSITIIGENGTIKIGGQYLNTIDYWDVASFPLPKDIQYNDRPNTYGQYQGSSSNHDKVMNDVIVAISGKKSTVVDGSEGLKTVRAIELMYRNTKH